MIKYIKALISNLVVSEGARLRLIWYNNQIALALENHDDERVARLEAERDKC